MVCYGKERGELAHEWVKSEEIREWLPIHYASPGVHDATEMWELARRSGTLDLNSPYFYLTFADQFSDTSIVARFGDEVAGFIAGFRPPRSPDTLFVWQITVSPDHRRKGIGHGMLRALMALLADDGVRYMEATVTTSNEASMRMFRSLAEAYEAPCSRSLLYPSDAFPDGHEEEYLLRMGPFDRNELEARRREAATEQI